MTSQVTPSSLLISQSATRGAKSVAITHLPLLQWTLLVAAPILFAALALVLGKKTGWDFYNYHWYNAFALLNDRFGFDVAVGHHATYYNPLADLPLYLIASQGPAWLGGALMGAMAGVAVALIGVLAYAVLPVKNQWQRTGCSAALATLSALGAGALQEIGDPANDVPASIGIVGALILIVRYWQRPMYAATNAAVNADVPFRSRDIGVWVAAGMLSGLAVALKLTTAVYAVGIAGALLVVSVFFTPHKSSRGVIARVALKLMPSCVFSVGTLVGLLLVGGFWMLTLWRYSGNPFFPYFNDLVQSPLLIDASYRDLNFRPQGALRMALFPYYFTVNSRAVSESVFRDAHILILYALVPLTIAIRLVFKSAFKQTIAPSEYFLFVFAGIAYLAWMVIFGIYRYLIPLEMLAPLFIALAIGLWPLRPALRVIFTVFVLVVAQCLVRVDISDRQSWRGHYAEVTVPQLTTPSRTMILMTGHAPMAYVIPYFPHEIPFLRIDGWLIQGGDRVTGLARSMRERVAAHIGPLFILFEDQEHAAAVQAANNYGLQLLDEARGAHCHSVPSNINQSLQLCAVKKL